MSYFYLETKQCDLSSADNVSCEAKVRVANGSQLKLDYDLTETLQ
jgi:hypothetical protein